MRMKKLLIIGIAVLISITAFSAGCTEDDNGNGGEEEPDLDPAPDFTLTTIDGDNFTLSDYENSKVVILDFMFVNCSGCIEMMDVLKSVSDNYDSSDVIIITIDVVTEDTEEELRWFKNEYGGDWMYAFDTVDAHLDYDVTGVPVTVIVDKDGNIAFQDVGVTEYSEMSEEIDKLI
jgi:peroxiredoxin